MIHDLTRDSVFHNKRSFPSRIMLIPDLEKPEPYRYEALLTGDAFERMSKRFALDYESEQELCDCCGSSILSKPWSFEIVKLCKRCYDELESRVEPNPFPELKAWDLVPDPEDKPTNNIFLWD